MNYMSFPSPIDLITVAGDGRTLWQLHIEGDRYFRGVPHDWQSAPDDSLSQRVRSELEEYFAKRRQTFTMPVTLLGTPFQHKAGEALQTLSPGQTTSYAELARQISRPKAVRAVGTAIGRNPICIVVPCHCVIVGDGTLGGYVAGLEYKQFLLNLEGALTHA